MSLIPNLLLREVSQALSVTKVHWLMSIPWHPTDLTSAGHSRVHARPCQSVNIASDQLHEAQVRKSYFVP